MDESIEQVRRDLDETRARMSLTVEELTDRITHPTRVVREKLDVSRAVREHPWMALGVALSAGFLLGATGADARAARATAGAARRAGMATKDGALVLVDKVRHRGDGAEPADDALSAEPAKPGLLTRLGDRLADALEGPLHQVSVELRRSLEAYGGAPPPPIEPRPSGI